MEFGHGFWGPVIATGAMVLGIAIAWLLLKGSHRITARKPTDDKVKTYACGEELKPGEARADSEQFYSAVRRVFRRFYRHVAPGHTGVLSTYLLWVLVGFIVILIAIWLALG